MAFPSARASAGFLLASAAAMSFAQTPPAPLSATASDPVALGLMQGSPPPADKQITFQNGGQFPNLRWTLQHLRELVPSRNVWRGTGAASELPRAERDWSAFTFADDRGQQVGIDAYAERSYTDAVVVLHKGRVVLERYWTGMTPNTPHAVFSVTKSLTGVLAAQLIAEGSDIADEFEGSTAELLSLLMHSWWERVGNTPAGGIHKIMMSEVRNFPEMAQFYRDEGRTLADVPLASG